MSDFMATCPWCSERFTHAKDYLSHLPLHRGPAVESPRVPAYQPILPPVPPQSLEVSVSDPLIPVPVSPTGAPTLPQIAVKVAALVAGVAGVIIAKDVFPDHTLIDRVCVWILVLSGPFGIVSQGVRR